MLILVKYIPIIIAIGYIIYYVFTINEIDVNWIKYFGKISFMSLLYFYVSSYTFGFCWRHRLSLYYILLCNITDLYDRYFDYHVSVLEWSIVKIIIGCLCIGIIIGSHCKPCYHKLHIPNFDMV